MGIPSAEDSAPALDEQQIAQKHQERCERDPFPVDLNSGEPRLYRRPLPRERADSEEKYGGREDPLRGLEKPTTR